MSDPNTLVNDIALTSKEVRHILTALNCYRKILLKEEDADGGLGDTFEDLSLNMQLFKKLESEYRKTMDNQS